MTSEKQRRKSILITRHYPDLGSVSDWLNQISHLSRVIRSTTQIWVVTRYQYGISALFLRRHLAGKQVAASPNVGCCVRLLLHNVFRKNFVTKLSVGKSLSFLQSHVPSNSSICQSEEGLNLFSPEPFWLFISCLHDDAYLSTIVIKEQIKNFVCPWHNKANRFNVKHRRDFDQFKIQSC